MCLVIHFSNKAFHIDILHDRMPWLKVVRVCYPWVINVKFGGGKIVNSNVLSVILTWHTSPWTTQKSLHHDTLKKSFCFICRRDRKRLSTNIDFAKKDPRASKYDFLLSNLLSVEITLFCIGLPYQPRKSVITNWFCKETEWLHTLAGK